MVALLQPVEGMKTREIPGGTGPLPSPRRSKKRRLRLAELLRMNKSYRQGQILKLIRSRRLHTQEELAARSAPWALPPPRSPSRAICGNSVWSRLPEGYSQLARKPCLPARALLRVAREFLLDIRVAQNLLVLRTPPATRERRWPRRSTRRIGRRYRDNRRGRHCAGGRAGFTDCGGAARQATGVSQVAFKTCPAHISAKGCGRLSGVTAGPSPWSGPTILRRIL